MTVGTRMWSEQPVNTRQDRLILAGRAPSTTPPKPPMVAPTSMSWVDIGSDVSGTLTQLFISMSAGQQALLISTTDTAQTQTIDSAWTILMQGTTDGQTWAVLTRKATVNETVRISYTGPQTHSYNHLEAQGFIITGPIDYQFIVNKIAETVSPTVVVHAWDGLPTAYRLRALLARGCYANWTVGGDGHPTLDLGYTYPKSSWWNRSGASNPATYLKSDWSYGTWTHRNAAVVGPPTWTEFHIEIEAA